jgi:hypothetical protein
MRNHRVHRAAQNPRDDEIVLILNGQLARSDL